MTNGLKRFKSITKKDLKKLSTEKLQDLIDDLLFLELFSKTPKLDINTFVIQKITEVRDILESRGIFLNKRREINFKKAQQRRKN
tara:strand:+ start:3079 stop:3333 length:255 start_codon:yes stop_codon:yes gene_type:complete